MKSVAIPIGGFIHFGMLMDDRHTAPTNYRYGFNGKEKDNEVKVMILVPGSTTPGLEGG